jgi:hypothetical protein
MGNYHALHLSTTESFNSVGKEKITVSPGNIKMYVLEGGGGAPVA